MKENRSQHELMTAKEVGRRLGIVYRTVWLWTAKGYLPAPIYVAPGTPRWKRSELEAWLASRPKYE